MKLTPEQDKLFAEAKDALSKAKIQLMAKADSAFFTTLAFSFRYHWNWDIPTAGTDGSAIYLNPKFFMDLDREERVFLILHEVLHCAYLHTIRKGARAHQRWNIAADHVINLQLKARGFRMPSMGVADDQYSGLSADEVYDRLPQNEPLDPQLMDLMPQEGNTPEDNAHKEALRQQVADILVRASIQSKMSNDKAGTIPGEIEIFLNRLLNPKLPWNRILQKYLQSYAKTDYSFKKPNRRFFPEHILPSMHGHALVDLAVAVDTSGSVSDQDFLRFVTETHSILRMMKPNKMTLIQFDTKLKSVDAISSIPELMKVQFTGRGGTEITPVLDWANANKPQLLLVFSDGEFSFPGFDTKCNTLWLIHENPGWEAPFGKVIHYSMKD